ncbi:MAG: tRNA (adenosine(37)-N6)-threonylcarbamoyltransferase complex dimerization subunit type 1 TsaB [Hyphomicrobiales bacterium]|nr:tRNA (adenosine(37)-N6)-threonylcarbamoyltransferase complex dimerization subunit type 1 TsaB [Hyphomicrobiales bacterium]
MILLAIETVASLCAACVHDTAAGAELGREVLDIGKGHAERLIGVIESALGQAGITYNDLDRIGVAVGPGSFTGVRVGVATARGLALALSIPATGVNTLEALAAEARTGFPGRPILAVIDGRRGDIYCAAYAPDGAVLSVPAAVSVADAVSLARRHDAALAGNGADAILAATDDNAPFDTGLRGATADIGVYARLATGREATNEKPKPLYLRGADAKPQSGFALARAGS